MAELNVQQKNIVNQLRQAYPELKSYSDEQILSLYNQQLNNIQLSEDERISIMNGRNGISNDGMGLRLEGTQTSVGKEQEAQLKSALTARLNAVSTNVKKAEDSNGFLGSMWSGFKNLTGIGDSSDKVREQQKADLKALESGNIAEAFKKITGLDYTIENVNKFLNNEVQTKSETALNGYTEGQEMASDITADIVSGIAAVGIYTAAVAAAPFTGGASIVVGVAAAGASAAAIKTGIKYADAKSGGREYTADNLKKDLATGAFSGVLAPITGGMGGAVGKTVATKVGIQAVKQVGKEVAEEAVEQTAKGFVKTMLTNPTGYEYIGGNMVKRGLAFAAEAATDGAIGGAVDNAFRTAYDGGSLEDIGNSAVEGFVGGAIMSPVIGGGMKVAGKGAQKIFGKNNVEIDANGNRVRVNDDGTVVRIDENGNEIPASATDAEIHIPKGVLASDIAPFIETDDGFRNIARNRARDIAELDKIKDVDEFLEKSFSMIKEEMGLADSPIKFEITNGDNQYDLETNTVSINPNWANGDKAELFGAIAHELDHFLQWKAVMRNVDENHPMYKAVYDQLTLTKVGYDNLSYILFKNEAPATELLKKQAKEYADNWQNYIEPADPKTGKVDVTSEQYKRYKEQPVEAEAMRRGEIVVEEYRRAISGNNSPSGTIADKSELYQRALSENPAEVVADKVYREWTTADVNTRVADEPVDLFNLDPYAGLKQSAPEVNGEVTSLIFTGKLKQKLTQRYVDLENTFKDIAKKRSSDIKALANACGNDRDKFANGLVEMLCEDLGMKGIAPQVKFIDINRGTVRGQANYFSGCIQIDSQVRTANELVDIVSHELTHMMQFKDILVQYGEKGIRELIKNTPDNLKERDFNAILNNPFTQKILQNIDSFKQDDVGSLNEFIKRIYKEELATGVDTQKNPEIYFNQLLEREAYHLASEQIGKGVRSVDDVYFDEFNFEFDPITGEFLLPSGILPNSNNYLQRIQRVHFSTNGGLKTSEVKVYESFRRAMHKVLIATNGNAELPDNIHFREIPDHINGIACKDAATQSISINRCFLDNLDSSISKYIKGLQDVEMLKVDADGKIHISDFLRNDLTIEFEKKLNAYNESLSLADKLELYTQMGYFINLQNQARTNPIVTIEKIMVTGDNQAVLKKRGLFKSRDEVASMTAKEQVAYLKEIALITKIPEDAVLIRDVDQIFTHELGHLNHKLTPADESYLTSKAVIDEHRNNVAIQNTCSKVTQYAKESPKEFVAEVYSGLINGQKFDDDVMALYRKYKGPEVENATRANLPAGVVMSDESLTNEIIALEFKGPIGNYTYARITKGFEKNPSEMKNFQLAIKELEEIIPEGSNFDYDLLSSAVSYKGRVNYDYINNLQYIVKSGVDLNLVSQNYDAVANAKTIVSLLKESGSIEDIKKALNLKQKYNCIQINSLNQLQDIIAIENKFKEMKPNANVNTSTKSLLSRFSGLSSDSSSDVSIEDLLKIAFTSYSEDIPNSTLILRHIKNFIENDVKPDVIYKFYNSLSVVEKNSLNEETIKVLTEALKNENITDILAPEVKKGGFFRTVNFGLQDSNKINLDINRKLRYIVSFAENNIQKPKELIETLCNNGINPTKVEIEDLQKIQSLVEDVEKVPNIMSALMLSKLNITVENIQLIQRLNRFKFIDKDIASIVKSLKSSDGKIHTEILDTIEGLFDNKIHYYGEVVSKVASLLKNEKGDFDFSKIEKYKKYIDKGIKIEELVRFLQLESVCSKNVDVQVLANQLLNQGCSFEYSANLIFLANQDGFNKDIYDAGIKLFKKDLGIKTENYASAVEDFKINALALCSNKGHKLNLEALDSLEKFISLGLTDASALKNIMLKSVNNGEYNPKIIASLKKIALEGYDINLYARTIANCYNPKNSDINIELFKTVYKSINDGDIDVLGAEQILSICNLDNAEIEFKTICKNIKDRQLNLIYSCAPRDFDYINMLEVAKLPEDIWEIVKSRNIITFHADDINIVGSKPDLKAKHYEYLAKLSDENFEKITKALGEKRYWGDELNRIIPFDRYIGIQSLHELSKTQKRELIMDLMQNKNIFEYNYRIKQKDAVNLIPLLPQNSDEYMTLIRKLSNSLNINFDKLSVKEIEEFNIALLNLQSIIKIINLSNLEKVDLSMSHKEFINEFQRLTKNLSKNEKTKIEDYFGFQIVDDKLVGYPTLKTDNPEIYEIKDTKTLNILKEFEIIVKKYLDGNLITIKNLPELNDIIKKICNFMPEIYNQIDGSVAFADTMKTLQRIIQQANFSKLSDSDKKVITIATLLHNTDRISNSTTESAFDAYFISKKFDLSEEEARKVYKIIENSDLINKFMSTEKRETITEFYGQKIVGNDRANVFDYLAFNMKESNIFELSQMLYSAKETEGLTRYLDQLLSIRIEQIKAQDFALPQTSITDLRKYATKKTIDMGDTLYEIEVIDTQKVPDFQAFIHTPDAGAASGGSRGMNVASFDVFKALFDDKVICASYIGKGKTGAFGKNGLIISVAPQNQYVGYGHDIYSISKNLKDMIVEYYRDRGVKAAQNKGEKFTHRTFISEKLKSILNISDKEYILRLDNLKKQLKDKDFTLENIMQIDAEMGNAYFEFFNMQTMNGGLLRNNWHNEVLVSSPEVQAIYTKDLEQLPSEYLKIAQEQNLPIVIL